MLLDFLNFSGKCSPQMKRLVATPLLILAILMGVAPVDHCLLITLGLKCGASCNCAAECSCCGKKQSGSESTCSSCGSPISSKHKDCCVYAPQDRFEAQSQHVPAMDAFCGTPPLDFAAIVESLSTQTAHPIVIGDDPILRSSAPPLFLRVHSFLI